jgi:hypothetical protein
VAKKDAGEKVEVIGGKTAMQEPGIDDVTVTVGNDEYPTDGSKPASLDTALVVHDLPDLSTPVKAVEPAKTETPEVATEEPTETPNAEDDGFIARAKEAFYTEDDVKELGRPAIERMMAAEDRKLLAQGRAILARQHPQDQAPQFAPTPTPDPEIDLALSEELSEEDRGKLSKWAKSQAAQAKALQDKVNMLESRFAPIQQHTQDIYNRQIEAEFGKLNPTLFGQGQWESVDASCKQNRERLVTAARAWNIGLTAVGLPKLDLIEAMKRAYSAEFYTEARKQVQNKAVSKLTKKIEQQSSQIIGRPQTAKATSGLTPYEETVKFAAERMGQRFDLSEVRSQNDGLPVEG